MVGSLLRPDLDAYARFDYMENQWSLLAGGKKMGYSNSMYLSERQNCDRNFALAHFMREHGQLPENADIQEVLEFFIQVK